MDDYVELSFSSDGNIIPSGLMKDFNLDAYDENFREAELIDSSQRIESLLKGFSYDKQVIHEFIRLIGNEISFNVNAVILLYNYRVNDSTIESMTNKDFKLRFMGVVNLAEKMS